MKVNNPNVNKKRLKLTKTNTNDKSTIKLLNLLNQIGKHKNKYSKYE